MFFEGTTYGKINDCLSTKKSLPRVIIKSTFTKILWIIQSSMLKRNFVTLGGDKESD